MKRIEYLSYPLKNITPVYGLADAQVQIRTVKSLSRGDSCNTYSIMFENHWGTHIDCPAHFFEDGARVLDYEADFWLFKNSQIISLQVEPGQIIGKKDLSDKINPDIDLLLIKTGWDKYREQEIYSKYNPGLDPEVGIWLRSEFLAMRAVGFDFISLSSYTNRQLGRQAHRAFLDPHGEGTPLMIIEDMCLSVNMENLQEVWVVPLRVKKIDSAPCTVIGVFE